ncbi:MAG TPA: flippase [Bacteroidota bacterium]|nr:flippase [Bacteroidota bacterium]
MKQVSKNVIALTVADLIGKISGFVVVVILARVLSAQDFGAVNIAYAVLAYGVVLSAGGLTKIGIRNIAQGAETTIVNEIMSERLVTTCIVVILMILSALFFVGDSLTQLLIILFSFVLLPQALSLEWYFQGKESMRIVGVARGLSSIVAMIAVVIFVRSAEQVWILAVGTIFGEVCASLLLFRSYRRTSPNFRLKIKPSLNLFFRSLPLTVGVILATLVINFPPLALGIVRSPQEVGIYSAACKLVFFLLIGDRMLNSILLPAVSRKIVSSRESLSDLIHEAIRWTLLLALPIVVGGSILASELLVFIFGETYKASTPVLQVFLWYFLITMLHTIMTAVIIALHREKTYSSIMIATAVLYVCCVTIGAIAAGAVGTAAGVVISEIVSLVLMWIEVRKEIPIRIPSTLIQCLLASALMGVALVYSTSLWLVVRILLGACVYGVILFLSGGIKYDDICTLRERFL